jgi:2-oxoglutarate dehydrogenase E1 component
MGAWRYLRARFGETLYGRKFSCISRPASASPATGSHNSHKQEQEQLIAEAFGESSAQQKTKENLYANRIESPVSR